MQFKKAGLFFLFCLGIPFFSVAQSKDTLIVNKYNKWLKTFQLDQILTATGIKHINIPKSTNDSLSNTNLQVLTVLILKPAANYTDPQTLANAWNYISYGLQKRDIDINQLLLYQLAAYTNMPLSNVKIEAQTSDPEIFSVNIFYKDKLENKNQINRVMGGDISLEYDFSAPALNSILQNTYTLKTPVNDLRRYYKLWEAFFKSCKHQDKPAIAVEPVINESGTMCLAVSNVFGEVTGMRYHEKIMFTINIIHPENKSFQIKYLATVQYAGGIGDAPVDDDEYADVASERTFSSAIANFKKTIDKQVLTIFPCQP